MTTLLWLFAAVLYFTTACVGTRSDTFKTNVLTGTAGLATAVAVVRFLHALHGRPVTPPADVGGWLLLVVVSALALPSISSRRWVGVAILVGHLLVLLAAGLVWLR